jgi:hypothetical protein
VSWFGKSARSLVDHAAGQVEQAHQAIEARLSRFMASPSPITEALRARAAQLRDDSMESLRGDLDARGRWLEEHLGQLSLLMDSVDALPELRHASAVAIGAIRHLEAFGSSVAIHHHVVDLSWTKAEKPAPGPFVVVVALIPRASLPAGRAP